MSAGFANFPAIRELPRNDGRRQFILCEPLVYETEGGSVYAVPVNFTTDLASIPRICWPIVSPFECMREAILHDFLYWLRGGEPYLVTREQADMRFLLTLRARRLPFSNRQELPEWKCVAMWRAVRWFGGIGWAKKPEPWGDPLKPAIV